MREGEGEKVCLHIIQYCILHTVDSRYSDSIFSEITVYHTVR